MYLCLHCVSVPAEGGGARRGTGSSQHTDTPCRLRQVSVNPAYQAMELEFALKKVGSVPGGGAGGVPGTGGFRLRRWGRPAQVGVPGVCPSLGCEWVGGGGGWADTKLVYVFGGVGGVWWYMHGSWQSCVSELVCAVLEVVQVCMGGGACV